MSESDITLVQERNLEDCGVRDKYAKRWDENLLADHFQLYTKNSKPGLVSIFYNEDQRSFHNWGLEFGKGQKHGRIRQTIDHQINTPVLEIAGLHDGSVYMVCPPDPNSTINVDMPYVTMLMKDMHGYSSVEFTVLDTLGFSRKICAKNFKSICSIGELNCEIPMRLSPTWNYACINLDEALRNAFGTRLIFVQRIKINANVRVRRIYFHKEIFPFKSLPQEFRIKLTLTPQEKQEILMYEEFLYSEPSTSPEKNIPWSMPRLMVNQTSAITHASRKSTTANVLPHSVMRRRIEIMEVPSREDDSDKYTNVPEIQTASNSGRLREMLQKSLPPSKILLPTLSLIYPDKKANDDAAIVQAEKINEYRHKKGHKEGHFFGREHGSAEFNKRKESCNTTSTSDDVDAKAEHLRKMKNCIEKVSPRLDVQDENGNSNFAWQMQSDWEKFTNPDAHEHRRSDHHPSRQSGAGPEQSASFGERNGDGGSPRGEHDHHSHDCGKYTVSELAQYLKHREIFGDYDMFSSTLGNTKFLMVPGEETVENASDSESASEDDLHSDVSLGDLDAKSNHTAVENPFMADLRGSTYFSQRKSDVRQNQQLPPSRRSTVSKLVIQDPTKSTTEEVTSSLDTDVYSTESLAIEDY